MSLRSLPRIFLPGADMSEAVMLPPEEADKLRKVLRLGTGDSVAVLPNDGSLWRCRLEGKSVIPETQEWPGTEPEIEIILAQALPKADRLETVMRMGTEIGVRQFTLFASERSVVRWEPGKLESKLVRLRSIVRESAEQSYRCELPRVAIASSLQEILDAEPDALVLSEVEGTGTYLFERAVQLLSTGTKRLTLVVGPEGGWAPRELSLIGERGVTLGQLVLRTDTAGPAAAAAVLFGAYAACRRKSVSA